MKSKNRLKVLIALCAILLGSGFMPVDICAQTCPPPHSVSAELHSPEWYNVDLNWKSPVENLPVVYNNGEFITNQGEGANGADLSVLPSTDQILGTSINIGFWYSIADDFTLTKDTYVAEIEFFVYMGGAPSNVSPIQYAFLQLYNANPSTNGQVIWGDLLNNRMQSSSFINAYRVDASNMLSTKGAIMSVKVAVNHMLPAGTYWLQVGMIGDRTYTGPYAFPVTNPATGMKTGTAMEYNVVDGWKLWQDLRSERRCELPFVVYGYSSNADFIQGYNVYRDNNKLNDTLVSYPLRYHDPVPSAGNYQYAVSSLWNNGCESEKTILNVQVDSDPCEVPVTDFPLVEGFESGTFSDCWRQEKISGSWKWEIAMAGTGNPATAHSGNYKVSLPIVGKGTSRLIMPVMDLTNVFNPVLNFWHSQVADGGGSWNRLRVYYKTSLHGEWILLRDFPDKINTWQNDIIPLPNPNASYYIAFEGSSVASNSIMLDDIRIETSTVCKPVSNVIYNIEDRNNVLLSWVAPPADPGLLSYSIYRNNALVASSVTATSYTDAGVAKGTYAYCIEANYENACTASSKVCVSNVMINDLCNDVNPPQNLTTVLHTPEWFSTKLSWSAPQIISGKGISGYVIYRNGQRINGALVTSLAYTDRVESAGTYKYEVAAVWNNNCESSPIAESVVFDPSPCLNAKPLPIFEFFDDEVFPANCWSIESATNTNWTATPVGTAPYLNVPHSGSKFAQFACNSYANGSKGLLISPQLKTDAESYQLSFWMYRDAGYSNNLDKLNVYFSDTKEITGSTPILTIHRARGQAPVTAEIGWQHYTVDLNCYGIPSGYVIFEGVSAKGYNIYLDDIQISVPEPSTCDKPSNLQYTLHEPEWLNVALAWDAVGPDPEMYFSESFDTGIPATWTIFDNDGDGYKWYQTIGTPYNTPYEGAGCVYSESAHNTDEGDFISLTPDNWLITPQITIQDGATLQYYVSPQDKTFPAEHYGVYISTTGTNLTDFTPLFEETLTKPITEDWFERRVSLAGYSGQIYIAFRHFNCEDQFVLKLDEVSIFKIAEPYVRGYNVYRDGTKINATVLKKRNYLDETPKSGIYAYSVKAVWSNDCESDPEKAIVTIPDLCANPLDLQISESFDKATFPPLCWTSESADNAPWKRATAGSVPTCTPHSGAGMICFNSADYEAQKKGLLYTPLFNIDKNEYILSFWVYRDGFVSYIENHDKINIYLSATKDITGQTPVKTIHRSTFLAPAESTAGWHEYRVVLDCAGMSTAYVVFEGISNFGGNIYVDDISIGNYCPSLPGMLNYTLTGATRTDVALSWSAPDEGLDELTGYNVYRDEQRIASNISSTSYTDPAVAIGFHNYKVEAVYNNLCGVSNPLKREIAVTAQCGTYPQNAELIMHSPSWYDITMTWELPRPVENAMLEGYNVYRNGQKVNAEIITKTSLTETSIGIGSYEYSLTAVWSNACESEPVTFNIDITADPCETPREIPFDESFDTPVFTDNCWKTVSAHNTPWRNFEQGEYPTCEPHSGSGMVGFTCYTYLPNEKALLISPLLKTNNKNYKLSLWVFRDMASLGYLNVSDRVNIYLSKTQSVDGLSPVKTIHRSATLFPREPETGWYKYTIDLRSATMEEAYIILEGVSLFGANLYIDDISVFKGDDCSPVEDLSYTQVSSSSIELKWDTPLSTDVLGYKIYRDNQLIDSIASITRYVDNGLEPGTYSYCISAIYEDCQSRNECVEAEVIAEPCATPQNFTSLLHKPNSWYNVKLQWDMPTEHQAETPEKIFDNGPIVTDEGAGAGGADVSAYKTSPMQVSYTGVKIGSYVIADDFELTQETILSSVDFFAFQTNSGTTPTINKANVVIYNGDPSAGGEIVWGDRTTNVFASAEFTNTYRVLNTAMSDVTRPIMKVTVNLGNLHLPVGTYWIEVAFDGSISSGPFVFPVMGDDNVAITGNAKVQTVSTGVWANWVSASSPIAALPFVLNGTPIVTDVAGYNIFRDGEKLNAETIAGRTYLDLVQGPGVYNYSVSAVYNNYCESSKINHQVTMEINPCEVPITAFPYFEGFDSGSIPYCWEQDKDSKEIAWEAVTKTTGNPNTSPDDSDYKLRFTSSVAANTGATTKLITPMMDITALQNPILDFWHVQRNSGSYQDSLRIYYKNAADAEWVLLDKYTSLITNWQRDTIALPDASETYWIAFEGIFRRGGGVMLDAITVTSICDAPQSVTVSMLPYTGNCNAQVSWVAPVSGANKFNVYRDGTLIASNVEGTSYIDAGFTSGEQHQWCVATACGSSVESELVCGATGECTVPTYTITATASANGIISPSGSFTVTYGDSKTFSFVPNTGYKIAQILVDGVNNTIAVVNGSYTFSNVTANHTISAEFDVATYTIAATSGSGGSISPAGTATVTHGNNQTYTITADAGYKIKSVLVDGTAETAAVGASSYSYTFSNVTANHSISAEFEQNIFTITATAGANGTIAPSGTTTVTYGGNQAYTITADAGYRIKEVLIDGINNEDAVSNGSYTFVNVTANHTISAEFEQSIFTITATADANGTIAPNGATTLTYGDSQEYTITANEGYKIKSVLVDDVAETAAVGASSYSYTFSNVTANHTISAEFEQITYTIAATAGANGSITPGGTTTVSYGSNQAYTITANNDYLIKDVKVDGVAESAAVGKTTYNYTFSNVKANHTISATFEIANPELTGITVNNQPQTISSAMDYMAACGEQSVSMTLTSVGEVKVNGAAYTNGSPISLTGDKTVITITVTAGSNTATYTLTVAKALGDATPLYIERWGATIAIVNNPANNGGYTFDQIQWYKASDNTPAGTGAYVVGNISTHYADVHAVETGAWHHTCRTKATPAPVQIVVYPNPVLAAQTLNVKLPEGLNEVNIDVYDINGKLVKQHPRVTTTLTAPTGTGIYVLKIQLPDGSITTEKIVVK